MISADRRTIRTSFLVLSLAVPAVALAALCLGQNRPGLQVPKGPSGKVFKNIKVLKDLPSDQMIPVMHKISTSLGVRCDFCHVITADHKGFEKDDKPMKNKAREMIVMTGEIIKRFRTVNKKVGCFTCHHGHAEPEAMPEGLGRPGGPGRPGMPGRPGRPGPRR